jgi:hypothetical protein
MEKLPYDASWVMRLTGQLQPPILASDGWALAVMTRPRLQ